LTKAEKLPTTIREWQERVVRLDRNQRQSRAEKRMLERNAVCPGRNVQQRGEYGEGSYGGRRGQIIWRAGENVPNREGNQMGPRRDSNIIDVNKGRKGDRTYYVYGKWGHMAKNY